MTDEERYFIMLDEIEQLKADNKKLTEEISRCTSGNGTYISIESHNRFVAQLTERAEKAEARAEKAIKLLQTIDWVGSGAKERIEQTIEILCGGTSPKEKQKR